MKIVVGYDPVEEKALDALVRSVAANTLRAISIDLLNEEKLRSQGLYSRLMDKRGQYYDLISNAPSATEFSTSRFLTPIINQSGWVLFVDCDIVFLVDPHDILAHVDPSKAVMVVKHDHLGKEGIKMGGIEQTSYRRKNWSSVMLFNCDHPSNHRLSLHDVNSRPGRDLHRFYWLDDSEIGELPAEWNWLVGVQEMPDAPKIAHFTLGGPWIEGWQPTEYDDIWNRYGNKV